MTDKKDLTFSDLALALAGDYISLFVIFPDESYTEYVHDISCSQLVKVSEGADFFMGLSHRAERIVPDDREAFLSAFSRERVESAVRDGGSFSLVYRVITDNGSVYHQLKTIRTGSGCLIIGVQDIDRQKREELEREEDDIVYSEIADSLARLFEVIYHVDVKTGHYTEYSASESYSKLGINTCGLDFFKSAIVDAREYVHPDDLENFIRQTDRDVLLADLAARGSVSHVYRQMLDGEYRYMNLLAFRQKNDAKSLVVGIINVDAQKRRENESQNYSHIAAALASRYEVIYHVNILTNEYYEYSSSEKYAKLEVGTVGKDFFADCRINMQKDIYPEDLPMMSAAIQKDKMLDTLSKTGKMVLSYRLMLDGRPQYVSLYALHPEGDSEHIIVAVENIDETKRLELEYEHAVELATRDPLTGVKNKRAYAQAEAELDSHLDGKEDPEFAVVVCDINGLKQVNDRLGHKAGDDFIRSACMIICKTFSHSPVFRIGGDEFVVILKGNDFERRSILMKKMTVMLESQRHNGMRMLATGISVMRKGLDKRVQDVFQRADNRMYENKKQCKSSVH